MRVLAIETSCDETGVAIVEGEKIGDTVEFRVLGNALLSQAQLHAEYGGVFPTLAKREHEKNLPHMLEQALKNSGVKNPALVDAIAVTQGPGLEPALWTGIEFGRRLAKDSKTPLLAVNHMEGHIISSLVEEGKIRGARFPILGLLVSGGHTELVLMDEWFKYRLLGETLDDAVGEAFDKVARMLGLPYPGGPHISKHADVARTQNITSEIKLPRPMLSANNCDFSFSGLKTAALYALRDKGGIQSLSAEEIAAFAREFEDAVTEVLVAKTKRALEESGAQTFVLGGGVAANKNIREVLQNEVAKEFPDVQFKLPELAITGDNAIMIAQAALMHLLLGDWQVENHPEFRASGSLSLATNK